MYAPIPLPRFDGAGPDRSAIVDEIGAWVRSEPMRDLVRTFHVPFPAGDPRAVLDGVERISAEHWDFRKGRWSRAEARSLTRDPAFPQEQRSQIQATATALGLVRETMPAWSTYDHVLVLGSYIDTCVARAETAARLLAGTITAREVCGLSSFRPFESYDEDAAKQLGAAAGNEIEGMDFALRRAFDLGGPVEEQVEFDELDVHGSQLVRRYVAGDGLRVSVVAAKSSSRAGVRANTADTFRFWASSNLKGGDRLLLITNTYFVPFQHCDAIRVLGLPYRCGIDTIGVDPANHQVESLRYELNAADHLMELRSAVRSMRALHDAVTGGA